MLSRSTSSILQVTTRPRRLSSPPPATKCAARSTAPGVVAPAGGSAPRAAAGGASPRGSRRVYEGWWPVLFVLPSLPDALPTVVAEAMAAGLPIVATTVGGIPEMVRHGEAALLVPPEDSDALGAAVVRLLANPRQAAAMGRAGRRLVAARFDIRTQARALADDYRALAERGRR